LNYHPTNAQAAHHSLVSGVLKTFSQGLHFLDIFTDLSLAKIMYDESRGDHRADGNYKFAFAWILMCFWGPYIILYSSTINSFFLKGYFTESNWTKMGCFRKLYVFFLMTFLGLLFHGLLLDITLKIQSIVILISVPLHFIKNKKENNEAGTLFFDVSKGCETYVKDIFGMNFFEV